MSTDITYAEPHSLDWEQPLNELADGEFVPAGKYAITLSTGTGGVVVQGTPDEIAAFGEQVRSIVFNIAEHAARPLTHADFEFDNEDNMFMCPRCEVGLEPGDDANFAITIQRIDAHIASHRPEHERE